MIKFSSLSMILNIIKLHKYFLNIFAGEKSATFNCNFEMYNMYRQAAVFYINECIHRTNFKISENNTDCRSLNSCSHSSRNE